MIRILLLLLIFTIGNATFPSDWGTCFEAPKPHPVTPQQMKAAYEHVDYILSTVFESRIKTVGMSAGIVLNGELVWSKGYGLRDITNSTSVPDEYSNYGIGSISKIFAMLEMMKTQESGMINIEDIVQKYNPLFKVKNPFEPTGKPITFRQLACHLSGLPRESPCAAADFINNTQCNIDQVEAFKRIATMNMIERQDVLPIYSNLGFDVLGNSLAVMHKMNYIPMIDQHVVKPMGLTGTGVGLNNSPNSTTAFPYFIDRQFCDYCRQDFGWGNPAGGMYSTVKDLGKLMSMVMDTDKDDFLQGWSKRETLLPRYIDTDREGGFALPWELYRVGPYMVRTKRGDVEGYSSEILFVPELKLGMVVLTNVVEQAPVPTQAVAEYLVPFVDGLLRSLSSAAPAGPPGLSLMSFVGEYTANTDRIKRASLGRHSLKSASAYVDSPDNGKTLVFQNFGLKYVPEISKDNIVAFQTVRAPGDAETCITFQFEGMQLLLFTVTNGKVEGFTTENDWGVTWVKSGGSM